MDHPRLVISVTDSHREDIVMSRSVVHDTFVIERYYAHSPHRVYRAFADPAAKAAWFPEPSISADWKHDVDFRIGGHETLQGEIPNGAAVTFDARYQDIVEDERIVYSYEMTMDGRRISVSVATLEFVEHEGGTQLILTEQGAFLDGLDTNAARAHGTAEFLVTLERYLDGKWQRSDRRTS
jgi:uncharacterized protein YndB with AHSA1/START domain